MASTLPSAARLLDTARADSAEFDPWMANHLPMALVILDRLGAPPERLEAFAANYRAREPLRPLPEDQGRIDADSWREHLGQRDHEADYRAFFHREIERTGAAAAERMALPVLVPGIAASALHGLMRLAYAHLDEDTGEIARALGYWAATWLPLRDVDEAVPTTDQPAVLLATLRVHPELTEVQPEADLLWHWMRAVAAHPSFPPIAAQLQPSVDLLPRVAAVSLALMAGSMSFEALHAVTSAHWLRMAWTAWPDGSSATRYVWQAVAAIYPKIGMPDLPSAAALRIMRRQPAPPWPAITAAAIASDDEHDISFVFSAREEERCYGDPLYRLLAARRMRLA